MFTNCNVSLILSCQAVHGDPFCCCSILAECHYISCDIYMPSTAGCRGSLPNAVAPRKHHCSAHHFEVRREVWVLFRKLLHATADMCTGAAPHLHGQRFQAAQSSALSCSSGGLSLLSDEVPHLLLPHAGLQPTTAAMRWRRACSWTMCARCRVRVPSSRCAQSMRFTWGTSPSLTL